MACAHSSRREHLDSQWHPRFWIYSLQSLRTVGASVKAQFVPISVVCEEEAVMINTVK